MGETKSSHGFVYSGELTTVGSSVMKSVMLPDGETAYKPHFRKVRMEHESIKEFPALAEEIDVELSHDRRIMMAKNEDDMKMLNVAEEICQAMGAEITWLDKAGVLELEPGWDAASAGSTVPGR